MTKDWCVAMAEREGDSEVGVGSPVAWRLVVAKSALENWGRHFDWCAQRADHLAACSCGLASAISSLAASPSVVGETRDEPDEFAERLKFVADMLRSGVVGMGDDQNGELAEWFRPGFLIDAASEIDKARSRLSTLEAERDEARSMNEMYELARRFGTPFDPTGVKTGMEIKALRARVAELEAAASPDSIQVMTPAGIASVAREHRSEVES
jgi:hypothetical protein